MNTRRSYPRYIMPAGRNTINMFNSVSNTILYIQNYLTVGGNVNIPKNDEIFSNDRILSNISHFRLQFRF